MKFDDYNTSDKFETTDPIPPGNYVALVASAVDKPNSKKTGEYTKIEFIIARGDHKNRKVYSYFNFVNPSETAVSIAKREFRDLCVAVGIEGNITSSTAPVGRLVGLRLDVDGEYNRIREYVALPDGAAEKVDTSDLKMSTEAKIQSTTTAAATASTEDEDIPF